LNLIDHLLASSGVFHFRCSWCSASCSQSEREYSPGGTTVWEEAIGEARSSWQLSHLSGRLCEISWAALMGRRWPRSPSSSLRAETPLLPAWSCGSSTWLSNHKCGDKLHERWSPGAGSSSADSHIPSLAWTYSFAYTSVA